MLKPSAARHGGAPSGISPNWPVTVACATISPGGAARRPRGYRAKRKPRPAPRSDKRKIPPPQKIHPNAADPVERLEIDRPEPKSMRLTTMGLNDTTCRWLDDGAYCGHDVQGGSVYCPHHRQLAYQPREQLRRVGGARA